MDSRDDDIRFASAQGEDDVKGDNLESGMVVLSLVRNNKLLGSEEGNRTIGSVRSMNLSGK